jgi:DNA-binding LacI/PurR family transcriptional regulator/DNA-binding transcriptional ArsR family regulator
MNMQLQKRARHDDLADIIRHEVKTEYQPGRQLPGMRELAKRFDVSLNTLRVALLVLEKEGLLTLRQGRGVYVREQKNVLRIGVFVENDILRPNISIYHTSLPGALRRYFRDQGALPRVYIGTGQLGKPGDDNADWDLLEDLNAGRLDGVALCGCLRKPWYSIAEKLAIPVVGDSHYCYNSVAVDFFAIFRDGLRRLHAAGCRRIAVMSWMDLEAVGQLALVFDALGLERRPKWMRRDFEPLLPGAGWSEFREIWTAYREKPDGLLVCDDILFRDTVSAILELGIRVPDQLRIVTHANSGVDLLAPFPLTVAEVDTEDLAARMGDMLLKLICHEPVPEPQARLPIKWRENAAQWESASSVQSHGVVPERG